MNYMIEEVFEGDLIENYGIKLKGYYRYACDSGLVVIRTYCDTIEEANAKLDYLQNLWFNEKFLKDKNEAIKQFGAILMSAQIWEGFGFYNNNNPLNPFIIPDINGSSMTSKYQMPGIFIKFTLREKCDNKIK